jgi:hypothetical protein
LISKSMGNLAISLLSSKKLSIKTHGFASLHYCSFAKYLVLKYHLANLSYYKLLFFSITLSLSVNKITYMLNRIVLIGISRSFT